MLCVFIKNYGTRRMKMDNRVERGNKHEDHRNIWKIYRKME